MTAKLFFIIGDKLELGRPDKNHLFFLFSSSPGWFVQDGLW
jgi:hypothetical protein